MLAQLALCPGESQAFRQRSFRCLRLPTFGNKLVEFLCGDASNARSGYCIQLDHYAFVRILGCLEPMHQFLEGHSPLALPYLA